MTAAGPPTLQRQGWLYEQISGRLYRGGQLVATGYSGHGAGKNNPESQGIREVGPLPVGAWRMGPPFRSALHGPYVIPLTPGYGTVSFGRSGFLVHGDSLQHPGEASRGCIVVCRAAREELWASGDRLLEVVARLEPAQAVA